MKYCLALDLIDDETLIAEYEIRHKTVWPEIVDSIRESGITTMEIYRVFNRLFMIMETDEGFSFERKNALDSANPKVQQWEELMWRYQQIIPGRGAVAAMTLSVAKDYVGDHIRCNSISPARVHTPFVDGFLRENYPGKEKEMFDQLSKTQPIGRMAKPEEVAALALYLCSDEASFITGCDYPLDGGFLKLNT